MLVDVGTGFYVEKSTADAVKFYSDKIEDLSKNLGDIEKVVAGKNENLKVVEDGEFCYPPRWTCWILFLILHFFHFWLTCWICFCSSSSTAEDVDRGLWWCLETCSGGAGECRVGCG